MNWEDLKTFLSQKIPVPKAKEAVTKLEAQFFTVNLLLEATKDDLRPGQFPVGVIKVKKPDTNDPWAESKIFGELFDYMMFLKSTYNLKSIFGLLTCYSDWHVCSLGPFPPSLSSSCKAGPSCEMDSIKFSQQMEIDNVPVDEPKKKSKDEKKRKKQTPSQANGSSVFQKSNKATKIEADKDVTQQLYLSQSFKFLPKSSYTFPQLPTNL